jgi:(p)ppGpp synthase/HD superfamily hydrolase
MAFSDRLAEAFSFALDLHRDQFRKGGGTPYITHLMAVSALVGEYGGNENQVIAALLHDAIEDQGGEPTRLEIMRRFGDHVATLVVACSDAHEVPKPPWDSRKEAFVVAMHTASPEVRLIVAADKLHNARTTVRDLQFLGDPVWDRFSVGRDKTLWYYRAVLLALGTGWSHQILHELAHVVDDLHRLCEQARESC